MRQPHFHELHFGRLTPQVLDNAASPCPTQIIPYISVTEGGTEAEIPLHDREKGDKCHFSTRNTSQRPHH
jgi:hypothetical protein